MLMRILDNMMIKSSFSQTVILIIQIKVVATLPNPLHTGSCYHDAPPTNSTEDTFLQDFSKILKRKLMIFRGNLNHLRYYMQSEF